MFKAHKAALPAGCTTLPLNCKVNWSLITRLALSSQSVMTYSSVIAFVNCASSDSSLPKLSPAQLERTLGPFIPFVSYTMVKPNGNESGCFLALVSSIVAAAALYKIAEPSLKWTVVS